MRRFNVLLNMPASIGVNLRVTGHCRQGGRKYMEDFFSVAYQQTEDERDLEYAFFGIFDGHGGAEAAAFAKEHLMETIVKHKNFWSTNDNDILRAIKDGYIATHYAMWKEQEKWPKTALGLPSTAGTTASVAFIRRGKIYIGHVGDSCIVLGYQDPGCLDWQARPLTEEHKPENVLEMSRIKSCGGKVIAKSGVPRVVWNRPRIGHQGPVRRSTLIDEVPFLAVARSLGDLWSYNSQRDEFVVSPDPDCSVIPIDTSTFRCLIFGTDGLSNMLSPQMAVNIVQQAERHNENAALSDDPNRPGWLNPSKCLVEKALEKWSSTKMRADNTSVVTLMLDPPGPPRAQVLKNKKRNNYCYPDSGLKIVTRYEDFDSLSNNEVDNRPKLLEDEIIVAKKESVVSVPDRTEQPEDKIENDDVNEISLMPAAVADVDFVPRPRETLSYDVLNSCSSSVVNEEDVISGSLSDFKTETIQINEISSSSNDSLEVEDNSIYKAKTGTETRIIGTRSKRKEEVVVSTPKNNLTKSPEATINKTKESLRSMKSIKMKENVEPGSSKRKVSPSTDSLKESMEEESPRKKLRECPSRSLKNIEGEQQRQQLQKKQVKAPSPTAAAPLPPLQRIKNKQKLVPVNKETFKQKIKTLQGIMSSRVSHLTSGIVFERRNKFKKSKDECTSTILSSSSFGDEEIVVKKRAKHVMNEIKTEKTLRKSDRQRLNRLKLEKKSKVEKNFVFYGEGSKRSSRRALTKR